VKTNKKDEAKQEVSAELRKHLDKDVKAMKDVVKADVTHEAWKDLVTEEPDDKERKALKDEIASRVVAGQNQIGSQPLDF
jgi:hypothetical protein